MVLYCDLSKVIQLVNGKIRIPGYDGPEVVAEVSN